MYYGLKTGPVFEWLKTRWPILPFEKRAQIVSRKLPFEYLTVMFSDGDCICDKFFFSNRHLFIIFCLVG
jgi:hypothetical protein